MTQMIAWEINSQQAISILMTSDQYSANILEMNWDMSEVIFHLGRERNYSGKIEIFG